MKRRSVRYLFVYLLCLVTALQVWPLARAEEGGQCAHGHTEISRETVAQATCAEAGSVIEITVCQDCGQELSWQTVDIPALEHDYQEGVCVRCGQVYNGVETWAQL